MNSEWYLSLHSPILLACIGVHIFSIRFSLDTWLNGQNGQATPRPAPNSKTSYLFDVERIVRAVESLVGP